MISSPDPTDSIDIRNLDLVATMRSGRVLVTGAGVSNRGAITMLGDIGCPGVVIVSDSALDVLIAVNFSVRRVTTADARDELAGVVAIVTSPGRRPTSPLFSAAAGAGIPVFDDVALVFADDCTQLWGPKRTWLVVTGISGKTTTTSMLAAMLGKQGATVGNIGVTLYDALTIELRIEVLTAGPSSFQPYWAPNIRPDAGILLNLAGDHINWHGSYENYSMDKTRALRDTVAIYSAGDANVIERIEKMRKSDKLGNSVVGFTNGPPEAHQVGVRGGMIVDHTFGGGDAAADDSEPGIVIASMAGIFPPGRAGVLDAVATAAMARNIDTSPEQIVVALEIFGVRTHRGQIVHKANDVVWIDDSKVTNPHTAGAVLPGHERVVRTVDGRFKDAEISPLVAKRAHRLQVTVVLGVDRQLVSDAFSHIAPAVSVVVIDDTDKVGTMAKVCMAANEYTNPGDVVLLAPAAASLDIYSGMARRGDSFAQWAQKVTSTDG